MFMNDVQGGRFGFVRVQFDDNPWYETISVRRFFPDRQHEFAFDPRISDDFRLLRVHVESRWRGSRHHRSSTGGLPVLFIHGHRGGFSQASTLAGLAVERHRQERRMALTRSRKPGTPLPSEDDSEDAPPVVVYTLDLQGGPSAFHAGVLLAHAAFVNDCVRRLGELHPSGDPKKPTRVLLVGHSMGGMAARLGPLLPNHLPGSFDTIVSLSTPHQYHPYNADAKLARLYRRVNGLWAALALAGKDTHTREPNMQPLWDRLQQTVVVSVTGGESDRMVRPELASLSGIAAPNRGLFVLSEHIPGAWITTRHRDLCWCGQVFTVLMEAIAQMRVRSSLAARPEIGRNPSAGQKTEPSGWTWMEDPDQRWRHFARHLQPATLAPTPATLQPVHTFQGRWQADSTSWKRSVRGHTWDVILPKHRPTEVSRDDAGEDSSGGRCLPWSALFKPDGHSEAGDLQEPDGGDDTAAGADEERGDEQVDEARISPGGERVRASPFYERILEIATTERHVTVGIQVTLHTHPNAPPHRVLVASETSGRPSWSRWPDHLRRSYVHNWPEVGKPKTVMDYLHKHEYHLPEPPMESVLHSAHIHSKDPRAWLQYSKIFPLSVSQHVSTDATFWLRQLRLPVRPDGLPSGVRGHRDEENESAARYRSTSIDHGRGSRDDPLAGQEEDASPSWWVCAAVTPARPAANKSGRSLSTTAASSSAHRGGTTTGWVGVEDQGGHPTAPSGKGGTPLDMAGVTGAGWRPRLLIHASEPRSYVTFRADGSWEIRPGHKMVEHIPLPERPSSWMSYDVILRSAQCQSRPGSRQVAEDVPQFWPVVLFTEDSAGRLSDSAPWGHLLHCMGCPNGPLPSKPGPGSWEPTTKTAYPKPVARGIPPAGVPAPRVTTHRLALALAAPHPSHTTVNMSSLLLPSGRDNTISQRWYPRPSLLVFSDPSCRVEVSMRANWGDVPVRALFRRAPWIMLATISMTILIMVAQQREWRIRIAQYAASRRLWRRQTRRAWNKWARAMEEQLARDTGQQLLTPRDETHEALRAYHSKKQARRLRRDARRDRRRVSATAPVLPPTREEAPLPEEAPLQEEAASKQASHNAEGSVGRVVSERSRSESRDSSDSSDSSSSSSSSDSSSVSPASWSSSSPSHQLGSRVTPSERSDDSPPVEPTLPMDQLSSWRTPPLSTGWRWSPSRSPTQAFPSSAENPPKLDLQSLQSTPDNRPRDAPAAVSGSSSRNVGPDPSAAPWPTLPQWPHTTEPPSAPVFPSLAETIVRAGPWLIWVVLLLTTVVSVLGPSLVPPESWVRGAAPAFRVRTSGGPASDLWPTLIPQFGRQSESNEPTLSNPGASSAGQSRAMGEKESKYPYPHATAGGGGGAALWQSAPPDWDPPTWPELCVWFSAATLLLVGATLVLRALALLLSCAARGCVLAGRALNHSSWYALRRCCPLGAIRLQHLWLQACGDCAERYLSGQRQSLWDRLTGEPAPRAPDVYGAPHSAAILAPALHQSSAYPPSPQVAWEGDAVGADVWGNPSEGESEELQLSGPLQSPLVCSPSEGIAPLTVSEESLPLLVGDPAAWAGLLTDEAAAFLPEEAHGTAGSPNWIRARMERWAVAWSRRLREHLAAHEAAVPSATEDQGRESGTDDRFLVEANGGTGHMALSSTRWSATPESTHHLRITATPGPSLDGSGLASRADAHSSRAVPQQQLAPGGEPAASASTSMDALTPRGARRRGDRLQDSGALARTSSTGRHDNVPNGPLSAPGEYPSTAPNGRGLAPTASGSSWLHELGRLAGELWSGAGGDPRPRQLPLASQVKVHIPSGSGSGDRAAATSSQRRPRRKRKTSSWNQDEILADLPPDLPPPRPTRPDWMGINRPRMTVSTRAPHATGPAAPAEDEESSNTSEHSRRNRGVSRSMDEAWEPRSRGSSQGPDHPGALHARSLSEPEKWYDGSRLMDDVEAKPQTGSRTPSRIGLETAARVDAVGVPVGSGATVGDRAAVYDLVEEEEEEEEEEDLEQSESQAAEAVSFGGTQRRDILWDLGARVETAARESEVHRRSSGMSLESEQRAPHSSGRTGHSPRPQRGRPAALPLSHVADALRAAPPEAPLQEPVTLAGSRDTGDRSAKRPRHRHARGPANPQGTSLAVRLWWRLVDPAWSEWPISHSAHASRGGSTNVGDEEAGAPIDRGNTGRGACGRCSWIPPVGLCNWHRGICSKAPRVVARGRHSLQRLWRHVWRAPWVRWMQWGMWLVLLPMMYVFPWLVWLGVFGGLLLQATAIGSEVRLRWWSTGSARTSPPTTTNSPTGRRGSNLSDEILTPPAASSSWAASDSRFEANLIRYQETVVLLYTQVLLVKAMAVFFSVESAPSLRHPFHRDFIYVLPMVAHMLAARSALPRPGWFSLSLLFALTVVGTVLTQRLIYRLTYVIGIVSVVSFVQHMLV